MKFLKGVFLILLAAVLAAASVGCAKKDASADASKPYAGTKLTIFNWYDYMDEDVLAQFTEETGIKVDYTNFTTNEEMYTKLAASASSYDVIFPSDYIIERLIKEDMLHELDTAKMENYAGLLDWIKTTGFDPGGKYSVPYMWGTVGILYNAELVDEPITGWGALFDDRYKNNVIMMDSVRDTLGVGLRYLGYSMNATDPAELNAARDILIDQKKRGLVKAYYVDETKDMMVANEAALALVWSGDALYAMEKNEKLDYVVPEDGSNIWVDGMCIPKGSKNVEAAQIFIDFMCRPDIAFKNQQYIYYSTPVAAVVDLYTDEERADETLNPPQDVIDRCEFFTDISAHSDLYEGVWMEIKQAQ